MTSHLYKQWALLLAVSIPAGTRGGVHAYPESMRTGQAPKTFTYYKFDFTA